MSRMPISKARRPPMRSSSKPHGTAEKMYTNCQAPMMLPMAAWVRPSPASIGATMGAMLAATKPKLV